MRIMIDAKAGGCSNSSQRDSYREGGLRVLIKTLHNYNPMKTTNLSLQILKPVVAATVAIVIICGLSVQPARANYIVTLEQVGSNVVATGTGAIDLTGLSLLGTTSALDPFINPHVGFILTGASGIQDGYSGLN